MPEENLEVNLKQEHIEIKTEDDAVPSTSQAAHIDEKNTNEDITIKKEEIPSLDITDKIGVADKVDLYKAVFLDSSSESEDEIEEASDKKQESNNKIEQFKSTILSDDLIPKIKPLKEGILSNIDFSSFNKNKQPPDKPDDKVTEMQVEISQTRTDLSYGPQLPIKREETTITTNHVNMLSSDSDDCWIEKDEQVKKQKKSRHKKKDKKEKHKKHKHKKNKH